MTMVQIAAAQHCSACQIKIKIHILNGHQYLILKRIKSILIIFFWHTKTFSLIPLDRADWGLVHSRYHYFYSKVLIWARYTSHRSKAACKTSLSCQDVRIHRFLHKAGGIGLTTQHFCPNTAWKATCLSLFLIMIAIRKYFRNISFGAWKGGRSTIRWIELILSGKTMP